VVEKAAVGSEPSCSLQDRRPDLPAKPRPDNALGPEPSCSLQDSATADADRALSVAAGYAPPLAGEFASTAFGSWNSRRAIFCDSRKRPGHRGDRSESFAVDSRGGVAVGKRLGYRRPVEDESEKAETVVGNNDNGDHSSAGLQDQNGELLILPGASTKSEKRRKKFGRV
jgi:hypothetical protein